MPPTAVLQRRFNVTHDAAVGGTNPLYEEFERLKTFPVAWNGPFCKEELARDGFHFSGGKCVCAFCNFKLPQGLERELWVIHRETSPDCLFFLSSDVSGNVPLEEATNYRLEKHRLVSFLRTNWTFPVDPYDLAKWGFYWTGSGDVGRCAFCRLEVRGWEEGDRGQTEHERWNRQCAFIQGREVGNVPLGQETEGQNLVTDSTAVEVPRTFEQTINSDSTNCQQEIPIAPAAGSESLSDVPIAPASVPQDLSDVPMASAAVAQNLANGVHDAAVGGRNPLFVEFERLKSFPVVWNGPFSKVDLARNGFHLSGRKCVCAFCNLELPQRLERELWVLHLEISQNCPYFATSDVSGNVPLGDATNYRLEKHRLVSFLRTNWTAPVDPYDLAKWGFYWTGSADVGRCAFCRLEVRGWERGDRGQSEHERWNPQCAFIQGREVGNVPLGQETAEQNLATDLAVDRRSNGLENVHRIGHGPLKSAAELGVVTLDPPRHPEYASLQTRLNSYQTWPLSLKQRPKELAEAGFYYTSKGDRTICFQCGGGLKDWGPTDDPWVEHAVWFIQCTYLVMKKGLEYISRVQEAKRARDNKVSPNVNMNTNPSQVAAPAPPSLMEVETASSHEQKQCVKEGPNKTDDVAPPAVNNAQNRDTFLCKICYQKELSIVFLPCGHVAACADCASQLRDCPICRKTASAYIRAYLP